MIWLCLVLVFFVLLFFSLYGHIHFAKIPVYMRERLISFLENDSLGLGLAPLLAAAGGLVRSGSQCIKQLWRPATLWELGDVAAPPPPPPPPEPLTLCAGRV